MSISINQMLLHHVCAERSDAMLIELGEGRSIRIPASADVVAHFVLDGSINVAVEKTDLLTTLKQGEYALFMYGDQHRISLDENYSTKEHLISDWPQGDDISTLRVGGRPGAKFISAALRFIHSPITTRVQQPLPSLVALKHEAQPLLKNTALFCDMAQIAACCQGPCASAFVNALMNICIVQSMSAAYEGVKEDVDVHPGAKNWRSIIAAVRLLRIHSEKPWTVASLAGELGLSRACFAAKFRADVGIGPMEFLNKIRMEKAADLLREHDYQSISAIARQVGYLSGSAFARAFKAHYGISPRKYNLNQQNYSAGQGGDGPRSGGIWSH